MKLLSNNPVGDKNLGGLGPEMVQNGSKGYLSGLGPEMVSKLNMWIVWVALGSK